MTEPTARTSVDQRKQRLAHAARWALATVASVIFAMSFGFDYGVDNEVAYLLSGLRFAHPSLLANDWYAAHTTQYHPAFGYLTGVLLLIDHRGWSIAIALMVVITGCMLAVYRLCEQLIGRRSALPVFFLVLALALVTRTRSVGISYIVDHILQPSTVGSLGFLISIPLYLSGRWLASGIALGLGGLFHANFLVLGFPVFGLAHLLQGREGLIRRGLLQLGPSLVAVALLSPILIASARSPHAAEAQQIYFFLRSPHHYRPQTYELNFVPFAAWQMLGIGLGFNLLRGLGDRGRRLGTLLVALLAVLWTGTVLTTATYIPRVAQVFVWRLAPFADLLCQLFACIAVVRALQERDFGRRLSWGSWALALAGLGFLLMFYGNRKDDTFVEVLLYLAAPGAVGLLIHRIARELPDAKWQSTVARLWSRSNVWIIGAAGILLAAHFAKAPLKNAMTRSTLIEGLPRADVELFDWMKKDTPKDARFLSPPDIETIRYQGERAIVVDWKSTPILPDELVEWRNRMADVTGRPRFGGWGDVRGYDSLDQRRLDWLREKYHLDYVIVRRGRDRGLTGRRVFENSQFVVLAL